MEIVKVKNLQKTYEFYRKEAGILGTIKSFFNRKKLYTDAVQDISFSIEEGEIIGFIGPNGAGKTTTLKMLSGILYPTEGKIEVLGFIPQERKNDFKKQFGIVMGQKNQLMDAIPAMDNFLLFKEFYNISDNDFDSIIKELTHSLDIKNILDIPIRKLSLGQRMKCELVAALIHNPKVLFLDEPTIGLDVVAQKNIRDFIKKYNKQKKTTIILTSHYMDDIKELCERVIIINFGKIIYDGKLSSLINIYAKEKLITVTTTEVVNKIEFEKFGKVDSYEGIKFTISVPREQVKSIASEIFSSTLPIDDINIDEMPIDDIIRAIFETKNG